MPKIPGVKHRDAVRALQKAGFRIVREGSRVTVPGKPSDDVAPGTKNSIFKQAGWK
jgi:predicted RNA binding protein YcfA (HicA-like mRNA interferase family)